MQFPTQLFREALPSLAQAPLVLGRSVLPRRICHDAAERAATQRGPRGATRRHARGGRAGRGGEPEPACPRLALPWGGAPLAAEPRL